eukprot:SAG31_NODE_46486_length_254_cov_0.670968_1_plen_84_part_11
MQEALLIVFECVEAPLPPPSQPRNNEPQPAPGGQQEPESKYDEYVAIINSLSKEELREICVEEGVLSADDSLLSIRAARLAHFC